MKKIWAIIRGWFSPQMDAGDREFYEAIQQVMKELVPNEQYTILCRKNRDGSLEFKIETTSVRAQVAWSEILFAIEKMKSDAITLKSDVHV